MNRVQFRRTLFFGVRISHNCSLSKSFSMYSSGSKENEKQEDELHVIDVRSDTVTKPTDEMRQVMANAEVGDDVFGEDSSVNQLQVKAATLLGKEAGLFVPSGSMGNLISIMAHCPNRGDEILVGHKSHIAIDEQGSCSQFGGIHSRQVLNNPDGTLDLDDMEAKIYNGVDIHSTHTKVICLEQTQNITGGLVLPLSYLDKVKHLATAHNLAIHMDGARLFNAVAALSVPASTVVKHMDSVTFCLSKGLGAPIGSVIVGSKDFIAKCTRLRKALGGAMRQAGIVAAAGIFALDNIAPKLVEDHEKAKSLAEGLSKLEGIELDPKGIHSNMVYFKVTCDSISANEIVRRMGMCSPDEPEDTRATIVKLLAESPRRIRIVFHHQVSSSDVDKIIQKLKNILR